MAPIAVFDHMATSARAVELKQAAAGKAMTSGEIKFSPYNQYSEYLKKHPEFPAKYPQYLPYDDDEGAEPHGEFDYVEPASRADPKMPQLFKEGVTMEEATPHIGTVISGLQLTSLSPAALDEVALLAAKRGVLIFKNQDLVDKGPDACADFGRHFGPLHHHPIMWRVKDHMDLQVVYAGPEEGGDKNYIEHNHADVTSGLRWHSDQMHEPQPPSVTMLCALELPKSGSGGDTLFSSAVACYNALSPEFRRMIDPLWWEATSKTQIARSVSIGATGRRQGMSVAHPVVIVHPVTGDRALFISKSFVGRILGLKLQESEVLARFLTDHLANAQDFQVRHKWSEGDVAVYDQRMVQHSAMVNYPAGTRRHLLRITPLGGRPQATPEAGKRPILDW